MTADQTTSPPPKRLDQSLIEGTQLAIKQLLGQFPDLRSVAIVLDYHLDEAGSLPAGTWLPSRPLTPHEVLSLCKAVDKVGLSIREQHDGAVVRRLEEVEQLLKKKEKPHGESARQEESGKVRPAGMGQSVPVESESS